MIKRILLIIALGVSFAPAAFADSGLLTERVCNGEYRAGEDSQCQLDQDVGAFQCDRQKALDAAIREFGTDGQGSAGGAF